MLKILVWTYGSGRDLGGLLYPTASTLGLLHEQLKGRREERETVGEGADEGKIIWVGVVCFDL